MPKKSNFDTARNAPRTTSAHLEAKYNAAVAAYATYDTALDEYTAAVDAYNAAASALAAARAHFEDIMKK